MDSKIIDMAKKALTPEQQEEYKKIGEYMYSNEAFKLMAEGPSIKPPKEENLLIYTTEALKSGLSPKELTAEELKVLIKFYGNSWYERFGYDKSEVPIPNIMLETGPPSRSTDSSRINPSVPTDSGVPTNISRQQRRLAERIAKKQERK